MQLWLITGLFCAFFTACCDTVSKKIMMSNDEWIAGGVTLSLASVLLCPMFLYIDLPEFSSEGAIALLILVPLESLGYYLFLSAIRMSPLSMTLPLLAFTPAITIVSGWLMLGEQVGREGISGVLLVTVGAYFLNADINNFSAPGPIRAIIADRGARRMLMVSAIWAITSTLGKKGAVMFGPLQFSFMMTAMIGAVFLSIGMARVKSGSARLAFNHRIAATFMIGAIFMAFQEVTHFMAVSMAPVAYMISVKRLSMVIGVIFGWRFFGESHLISRLTGSLIMLAGVILLSGITV